MKNRSALADILKGIAVVRMILVHLTDVFATTELSGSTTIKLLLFLAGPPGAALFMLIMGYFAAQSSKGFGSSVYRGLKLIIWGLLLNAGINFHLFLLIFQGNIDLNPWPYLFGVDILFLAGIGLILMAILKKLFHNNLIVWVLVFIAIAGLGHLLPVYSGKQLWLVYLQAFFYGDASWSYFPVFPWAAYPIAGYVYYLLDKQYGFSTFTRKGLVYLAFTLFIAVAITFSYGFSVIENYTSYYHHGLLFTIWLLCLTAFWIILIQLFTKGWENKLVLAWLQWVGRKVTNFYVIQWLLIGNIGTAVYKTQAGWTLMLWFLFILVLSSAITYFWIVLKKWIKRSS